MPHKPTQTERAYAALKGAVVRGEIEEGDFLVEAEMMRRYSIGRTPYREACNRLHHEGLLEVVPRRGYLVPELSFHAVRDLFESRLILESATAELAAVRAADDEVLEMERMARKRPGPDFEGIIRANADFHLLLAKMSRNRELHKLLGWNLEQTQRLMYVELRSSRAPLDGAEAFHLAIAAAIRKRDPEAAAAAVVADIADAQGNTFGRLRFTPGRRRLTP